jgi:hypothetical protein
MRRTKKRDFSALPPSAALMSVTPGPKKPL